MKHYASHTIIHTIILVTISLYILVNDNNDEKDAEITFETDCEF